MYARGSRYRQTPEVSRQNSSGRTLLVTDLRLRQPVPGSFQHTVESNDRLDHLAQRYYGKPRKWWRIGDANPQFASPLALLGHDPIRVARLVVQGGFPDPLWWKLLGSLRAVPGVEDVQFAIEPHIVGTAVVDAAVVTVRFNQATTAADALVAAASAAGFPTAPPQTADQVGKPITIPPEGLP
ncbi:MAG: hypothetical protein ACRDTH_11155 [Pseudonocardiaceae bacterium]